MSCSRNWGINVFGDDDVQSLFPQEETDRRNPCQGSFQRKHLLLLTVKKEEGGAREKKRRRTRRQHKRKQETREAGLREGEGDEEGEAVIQEDYKKSKGRLREE